MQKFIQNPNFYQDIIKHYLIGKNDFLYGTIIGFKKGWRKNKSSMEYYSFLLYFSHETGKIERFLYNSGSKEGNKDIYIYDKYQDIKESNNKKEEYIYIEELENIFSRDFINHLVNNLFKRLPLKYLNFNILNNGKLNKEFYSAFLLELMRDYFLSNNSFLDCDMNIIRHITKPIQKANIKEKHLMMKDLHLGCGDIDELKYNNYFKNLDLDKKEELKKYYKYYVNYKYIDYRRNQIFLKPFNEYKFKLKLNVPANFNNSYYSKLLNNNAFNFELVTLSKNELPLCLIELKNFINSRKILDYNDLKIKINQFNLRTEYKLNKFYNPLNNFNIQYRSIIVDN